MTKYNYYILLILVALSTNLFGQDNLTKTDSIELYAYNIDTTKANYIYSFNFSLDSIQICAKTKNNKIATTSFFERSKSYLTINYYFKDKQLILVRISEQCPNLDDLHNYSTFYFDNGKLVDEKYRQTIRPCLAYPRDKSIYEIFGYNPNLNSDFLKKYIIKLLDKVKLQPTKGLAILGQTK